MTSLADKAMLANLRVRTWTRSKTEQDVTEEVASNHSSDVNMGRYSKQLLPREAFAGILKAWNKADAEYRMYTLPWLDSGFRILSSASYFKFTQMMREDETEFNKAVESFIKVFPKHIEDARQRLGSLFKEDDYPKPKTLRDRFSFGYRILPLPAAEDFRILGLSDEEMETVRAEAEASQKEAVKQALADVARRIEDVVGHMAKRLNSGSTFRDTLVSNVFEMAELIPALNITDDPMLVDISNRMRETLCAFSPDQLRTNNTARERIAKEAADILTQVSVFAN